MPQTIRLLLNVHDSHDACEYPVHAIADIDEHIAGRILRRRQQFLLAKVEDDLLCWMEYQDDTVQFYSESSDLLDELQDALCKSEVVQVQEVPVGLEVLPVELSRLCISGDRFYTSAYVKHTALEIETVSLPYSALEHEW